MPSPVRFRTLSLTVLTRLASGELAPRRHASLYLAGWLVGRAVNRSRFIFAR
jgi:hypothetical protein